MSNERIDLAQFEGYTEWLPARTYNEQLLVQMKYAEALAEIARQREEDPHEMNHADDALVVNAAALIAELKRCYDEIDDLRARLMLAPYEEGDGYSVTCESCDKEWMILDAKLLARFIKEGKIVYEEPAHLESSDCPSCVTAAHE